MVVEINGSTVGECYKDALFKMRVHGRDTDTRNGRALTIEEPVVMTLRNPASRVLRDPVRNANPFFHCMEVVWMLSGGNKVDWIQTFNTRMVEFSNYGKINGAYGHRWMYPINQIVEASKKLQRDPYTRQAVIAMWDPAKDNEVAMKDYPCNTHIYFRLVQNKLDMTVCNRSNDLIWGMLGANVVHMTYLQELMCCMVNRPMGRYQVFTNNLHIYERHWDLLDTASQVETTDDDYDCGPVILDDDEGYQTLVNDCIRLMDGESTFVCSWIKYVAFPIYRAYVDKERRFEWIQKIQAPDWRIACRDWSSRKLESTAVQDKYLATILRD
jgi:hypothetical protein